MSDIKRPQQANSVFTAQLPSRTGFNHHWQQLPGSARALAIASAVDNDSRFSVVITESSSEALRLESELKFFQKKPVLLLPDWETLAYDNLSPHQDIISERLKTLDSLPKHKGATLIVPATTLMQRLAPTEFVVGNTLLFKAGDTLDIEALRLRLVEAGYHQVDTVYEHGEYAIRGAIVDLFPMGSQAPYRIELFDDEIESLRTFEPDTQLTLEKIEQINLLPAHEFPLNKAGINQFKLNWHDQFDVDHKNCPIYQDVSQGVAPAGIEYYLPLFFEHTANLFDYLPDDCAVFAIGDIEGACNRHWQDVKGRFDSRQGDRLRPILRPEQLFIAAPEIFAQLKNQVRISLHFASHESASASFATDLPAKLPIDSRSETPLGKVQTFLANTAGRTLFVAESAGRKQALEELLAKIKIKAQDTDNWQSFCASADKIAITIADIDTGLTLTHSDNKLSLITEQQLFGERIAQKRRRQKQSDAAEMAVKSLTELSIGAPVVHIDHGVGRYQGLETIDIDGEKTEFLMLTYADDAKLYVPVTSLHLISRYSGSDEELAPLHKLGNEQWSKAKRKAAEKIRDTAAELLEIYARRAAKKGHAFANPEQDYDVFSASFPFEETADQEAAIKAVRADMLSPKPMDRLVCGDVGFGKTEVAMRAAFIASHSGKQVAFLAPTTLLAQQHYQSLRDRFADWPVNIEVISRFKSQKEITEIQKKIQNGKIDILVGTHKLLGNDINFKELGLLIIDEEHRFGVRQKDALKSLRSEVDILTLTATPIPRTLNMSMAGIRDLSIIATAPAKRLSVKTFVQQHDDQTVKEAIMREILRGGQVYVLHNEVKSIEKTARELQELIPEARIGIGHGQMRERELEQVMSDFYHKRFNVLVCTTIIETGIDIPSANTILIHRADKFGLAQLHQLRGRVGRSHHQAYAYLLTPSPKSMTKDAVKRLEAISNAQDLGAGFTLATHDMEIRGAGELLGDEQSGQIQTIGFSLYMDMLDRAVKAMKSGNTINLESANDDNIEINLRIPALLPDDYVPDVHSRLVMYKRLANCKDARELKELQVEMIDRFGLLPEPAKNLIRVTELKLQAEQLGIRKLEANASGARLEFNQETSVDPMKIITLIQSSPDKYRFDGANCLKLLSTMDNTEQRLVDTEQLLKQLAG